MEAIPMPALICILGSSPQQQLFSFFSRKGGNGFDATEIQTETPPNSGRAVRIATGASLIKRAKQINGNCGGDYSNQQHFQFGR
jgi:hypothetical protein